MYYFFFNSAKLRRLVNVKTYSLDSVSDIFVIIRLFVNSIPANEVDPEDQRRLCKANVHLKIGRWIPTTNFEL